MARVTPETDLEAEVLRALDQVQKDHPDAAGVLAGAILQKLIEVFWDFDQNDFHTVMGQLFAQGLVAFSSSESRKLQLTPEGEKRHARLVQDAR